MKTKEFKLFLNGNYTNVMTTYVYSIHSTHVDKPRRVYDIYEVNGLRLFVIYNHIPWIDKKILTNYKLKINLLKYSQLQTNKISEIYAIEQEYIITAFYENMLPLLIKSANNFYSTETFYKFRKKYTKILQDKDTAIQFYNSIIEQYKKFNLETECMFDDVAPNNFLVNDDLTDFRIVDIASLRVKKFEIDFPFTQLIYGDGANDIGFFNEEEITKDWKYKTSDNLMTFCISTYNNIEYLKLAIESVRLNSFFNDSPFVIYAENCDDGTDVWLEGNKDKYNLLVFIEKNKTPRGIGGGMNYCADKVKTEYVCFIHSDFYVSNNWDLELLKIFDKYPADPMMVFSYRIQPNIFNESNDRPGTIIVDKDEFGEFYHNFDSSWFSIWATDFSKLNDIEIRKGEGVSGLIKKTDWDYIGGNDPLFAPASFEDNDLFLRMQLENYKIVLTTKSVIYHFGARGSHFPSDEFGQSSTRQIDSERKNASNWMKKWKVYPILDSTQFISIQGFEDRYKELKEQNNHIKFKF